MRRALVWLNLYGSEAVRHKLKNSLKTGKNAFFVFLGCKLNHAISLPHMWSIETQNFVRNMGMSVLRQGEKGIG